VALRGERFDGHQFLRQAFAAGAVAAMVQRDAVPESISEPLLVVDDTRLGLGALAAQWRKRSDAALVAVTGSNGKTTVKEMIAGILRVYCVARGGAEDQVLATAGNLNNDIGVPLTLFKLTPKHRYAVIEMGMNHPGEIGYLSKLARPRVALVNNVQRAHLGMFESVDAIARAKAEIFQGLDFEGVAVINADDPHAGLMRLLAGDRECLEFGLEKPAPIFARYELRDFASHIEITAPSGEAHVTLQQPGLHNVRNALAAATAGIALGVDLGSIATGLNRMSAVKGRLVRKAGLNGALVIDDSYNANPDSVRAAIDVLAAVKGTRILVLGDMGEIGDEGPPLHAEIGDAAKRAGIDALYALGELSAQTVAAFGAGAFHFAGVPELIAALQPQLQVGVTVLVKGSRFMAMERVVDAIAIGGKQ
jgi:UDP-N-acetylmuramoyl-tripeptide--D-alanyl-D-alanine ligase